MEATTLARVYALSLPHVKRKLSRQLGQRDQLVARLVGKDLEIDH